MQFSRGLIFLWCMLIRLDHLKSESKNFLNEYKIPKDPDDRSDPINIDTGSDDTHKRFMLKQINLNVLVSTKIKITKNDKLVEAMLTKPSSDNRLSGGVFEDETYILVKMKYLWTNDINKFAGTTIDEKGYPLEISLVFQNKKYNSFDEALNKEDGLAEVDFLVAICDSTSNEEFDKFAKILKKVQTNSEAQASLGVAIKWFAGSSTTPSNTTYYGYPGSYFDENTNERYFGTTVAIISNNPAQCLSQEQFEDTFGSFTKSSGEPLTNTQTPKKQKVPVVKSKGLSIHIEL